MFERLVSVLPLRILRWIGVSIGSPEHHLWYDHDRREYNEKGWGVVFNLKGGWMIRPFVRPFWWWEKYGRYIKPNDGPYTSIPNGWRNYDPKFHFLVRFWFPVLPFFSIAIGRFGFYIGFKEYDLDNPAGGDADLVGREYAKPGAKALAWSISARRTRWK